MTSEEGKLLACGALGVIFCTLANLRQLRIDAKKANINLTFREFLKMDWVGIALSFTSVLIWYLTFKEVANKYKLLQEFVRLSFVTMGGTGSYFIQLLFSGSRSWIRKVVDKKTNIADGKE